MAYREQSGTDRKDKNGTGTDSDTWLTQPRSLAVLAKSRNQFARNLARQIARYEAADEYNRAALRPIMLRTMERIEQKR
jgi:hypothetical protein